MVKDQVASLKWFVGCKSRVCFVISRLIFGSEFQCCCICFQVEACLLMSFICVVLFIFFNKDVTFFVCFRGNELSFPIKFIFWFFYLTSMMMMIRGCPVVSSVIYICLMRPCRVLVALLVLLTG